MTTRDRAILGVLAIFGLLGAFWFLGLSPKRSELKKLDAQVVESEQSLAAARQEADQFAKDRLAFPQAYTTMVRLGKAVPKDADVPSLVVQLEHVAADAGVSFRSVKVNAGKGGAAPAAAPPQAAPATTASSGTAGAGTTGSTGATGPASSSTSSSASGAGSATATAAAPAGAAPADATAAATLPIGTSVGTAGLPLMKLNLVFQGNFFKMANLVRNMRKLVKRQHRQLLVSGRLLTLDGFAFEEGDFGFPQVKATMATTAYLLPVSQGLLNGATPQGPPGAAAGTPTPISTSGASTPPAAVVTGP